MQRRHAEGKPYLQAYDIVSSRLQVADTLEGMELASRVRQYLVTAYRDILACPFAGVSTLFLLPSSGFVYHSRVGGKPRHDYSLEATVFLASANGRHMAGIYEVRGESYEQVASIYRPQAGEVSR